LPGKFVSTPVKEICVSKADLPETHVPAAGAEQPAPVQQRQQVEIDESKAASCYANFCRVTGTPEELIIDFGLNAQPFGVPGEPIKVSQRLVINYFTAKRLLNALHLTVKRHEDAFGVLETDVQKRVVGGLRMPPSSPR
jgi:hypothetical protein